MPSWSENSSVTPEFDIVWKKSAAKELQGLDQTIRGRVMAAIANLENDPFPHGVRKLQGTAHTFRLRVGDYRVVFQVSEPINQITIARVRHRRDVYRG